MNNQIEMSIVIVSWNAKKHLADCLESLAQYYPLSEVIVVDNASTDGSDEFISHYFPNVKLIQNDANLGFAKANNIGIAQSSGEYICLINSDVKFVHDCFTPMLAYMRGHSGVAMLGPQMLGSDRQVRRSTMRFPTVWNTFCRALAIDRVFKTSRRLGGQMVSDFDHKHTMNVEVLNGWFLMVRRRRSRKLDCWMSGSLCTAKISIGLTAFIAQQGSVYFLRKQTRFTMAARVRQIRQSGSISRCIVRWASTGGNTTVEPLSLRISASCGCISYFAWRGLWDC